MLLALEKDSLVPVRVENGVSLLLRVSQQSRILPLSENLEIFPSLGGDQFLDAVRDVLSVRVIEREVRGNLRENKDRVLDVHVTLRSERFLETLLRGGW